MTIVTETVDRLVVVYAAAELTMSESAHVLAARGAAPRRHTTTYIYNIKNSRVGVRSL